LRGLIDRTRFAISTEETRYYLNGIYLHAAKSEKVAVLRAVATDGHRLARVELPGRAVRLNITMDEGLVAAIDKVANNRSSFLADAARDALAKRRTRIVA